MPVVLGVVVVLAGLAALVTCVAEVGPAWLCGAGSVAVVTAYSWALAARTGGRPVVVALLALGMGLAVVLTDDDRLRTGAAVLTCVVSAVLAVMATVPAVRFLQVVREVVIAVVIAAIGALATIGFEPVVTVARFEYVTLGLAMLTVFALVYRLGAGLHGLGRRGIVIVLIGSRPARADPRCTPSCSVATAPRPWSRACWTPSPGAATTSARSRARSSSRSASPRSPGASTCAPGAGRAGGSARSA